MPRYLGSDLQERRYIRPMVMPPFEKPWKSIADEQPWKTKSFDSRGKPVSLILSNVMAQECSTDWRLATYMPRWHWQHPWKTRSTIEPSRLLHRAIWELYNAQVLRTPCTRGPKQLQGYWLTLRENKGVATKNDRRAKVYICMASNVTSRTTRRLAPVPKIR